MAVRLRLPHCGAHVPGTCLKLDADALSIDRVFVAIPGETFHPDRGDVAAKAPKPFQQGDLTTRAGGTECGGQASWAGPHDQDLGFMNYGDLFGGLLNVHGGAPRTIASASLNPTLAFANCPRVGSRK